MSVNRSPFWPLLLACLVAPAHSQGLVRTQRQTHQSPPARVAGPEIIDFEGLPAGARVSSVTGSAGTGPVLVSASNPALPGENAAILFNSSAPTGQDPDLGTPNSGFGGPGVGAGGGPGSSFPNNRSLGNVLIIAEDLVDADGDGNVDDPDDADLMREPIVFDFGAARVATVSITLLDIEAAEPPANVRLFDGAGSVLAEVLVPATGDNGLVDVDLSGTSGVARVEVTLNGSGAVDELTFHRECTGRIGDFVWHDLNRNGIQNAGEPGIMGVDVLLLDAGGTIVAVATTGASGDYEFTGLCHGDYTVIVDPMTLPPDFVQTLCVDGGANPLDSDCSPASVVLAADDTDHPLIDFGYVNLMDGELGDFVWHDENRDGLQDEGEPGIEGVVVRLLSGGSEIASTMTDRLGRYAFRGLRAGDYTLVIDESTLPRGFAPTPCDVGEDDEVDNDCSPVTRNLPSGSIQDASVDFGFASPCTGSLGDRVWHDENRNGMQDVEESGLEGVVVRLFDDQGIELGFSTTGPDGEYVFMGLCEGTYTIEVDESTLPPGYVPSPCNMGGDDTVDNDCSPLLVMLDADDQRRGDLDFGYRGTGVGRIGDFLWWDINCNGSQDVNTEGILAERGVEGVRILLRDDKGVILTTVTSNMEGDYLFSGLMDGNYIVEVDNTTIPAGLEDTDCDATSDDTTDSDCSPVVVTLGVVVSFTQELTIDFGFRSIDCAGLGCEDGFWGDPGNYPSWPEGITPDTQFRDLFEDAFPGHPALNTFRTLLRNQGTPLKDLGRETVTAFLNAISPDVYYELTPQQVIAEFDNVFPGTEADYDMLRNFFQSYNDRTCPFTVQ